MNFLLGSAFARCGLNIVCPSWSPAHAPSPSGPCPARAAAACRRARFCPARPHRPQRAGSDRGACPARCPAGGQRARRAGDRRRDHAHACGSRPRAAVAGLPARSHQHGNAAARQFRRLDRGALRPGLPRWRGAAGHFHGVAGDNAGDGHAAGDGRVAGSVAGSVDRDQPGAAQATAVLSRAGCRAARRAQEVRDRPRR